MSITTVLREAALLMQCGLYREAYTLLRMCPMSDVARLQRRLDGMRSMCQAMVR